jgi:DNA-binding transcriptional MerR regulator
MSSNEIKCTFLTHEVVVLTGFSKYMLDYLAREDIFRPSSRKNNVSGKRRLYSFEDVVLLRALKTICAGKGQIRHFTKSLKIYRKTFGPLRPGQHVKNILVVQGDRLCAYDNCKDAYDLISGQRTLSFVIDLEAVVRDVERHIDIDQQKLAFCLTKAAKSKANAERERNWEPVRVRRDKAKAQTA